MTGKVGNPYRDHSSGRFASATGLNKNNSTVLERGSGRLKEARSNAKKFLIGAAGIAAAGVGYAVLQGVQRPIRRHASQQTDRLTKAAIGRTEAAVAVYGPLVGMAIGSAISKSKTGAKMMDAHRNNMKNAGKIQHRAANISHVRSLIAATPPKKAAIPPPSLLPRPNRGPRLGQSRPRPRKP